MLIITPSSSSAPSCYRYARSSSRGAYITHYSWACGTDKSDVLVLLTATNGNQAPASSAARYTYAPYATAPTSSSSTRRKGGLTTRSIILIVVFGGGALFIALVLACICCQRHRKARRKAKITYQPPQVQQPPPMAVNGLIQGPAPVPVWNNGPPMHTPPPHETPFKPPPPRPVVHELTAPVRPLHEMPRTTDYV